MGLKKIHITNFKSLVDFKLDNLGQFCAFVGPNASGKSNIFEALEFSNYIFRYSFEAASFFGGKDSIYSYNPKSDIDEFQFKQGGQTFFFQFSDGIIIDFILGFFKDSHNIDRIGSIGSRSFDINGMAQLSALQVRNLDTRIEFINNLKKTGFSYQGGYEQFVDGFSRIFIGKSNLIKVYGSPQTSYSSLAPDASNLTQVIGGILENQEKRNDFIEWLTILIPEFSNIEIKKSNIDSSYDFNIYEKSSKKPFPRNLISDGTYNILALMAAVYQNDKPQFICFEEPENGLHPYAIQLLVDFFREKCESEGHTIWLNTHSQSLVRSLNIEEIILVNKVNGETKAKQLSKEDGVNLNIKIDEAWLSNALGGGVLWSK